MPNGATLPAGNKDAGRAQGTWRRRFGGVLTEFAIWLPLVISAGHVVVFTAWTTWVSFTASSLMPRLAAVSAVSSSWTSRSTRTTRRLSGNPSMCASRIRPIS